VDSPAASLRCRDVRLDLGGLPVLGGVDLDVRPGEFVALVGPSGCGKSTLLRVLAGLQPARGEVSPPPRPGSAALMPQHESLLPWRSLEDNVALGPALAGRPAPREAARAGLRAVGLAPFARAYPATLSGGMRQRAAFLRTVLAGLPLLLLDEPLGALDALTRMELQDWLEAAWLDVSLAGGRPAIVLVTHDVAEAVRLADRVVVLSPRPASVCGCVAVVAARPRPSAFRTSPGAAALQAEILALLEAGRRGA
jgi:putative hydroxymethylpyrimidine transport system ATP-binding protein